LLLQPIDSCDTKRVLSASIGKYDIVLKVVNQRICTDEKEYNDIVADVLMTLETKVNEIKTQMETFPEMITNLEAQINQINNL